MSALNVTATCDFYAKRSNGYSGSLGSGYFLTCCLIIGGLLDAPTPLGRTKALGSANFSSGVLVLHFTIYGYGHHTLSALFTSPMWPEPNFYNDISCSSMCRLTRRCRLTRGIHTVSCTALASHLRILGAISCTVYLQNLLRDADILRKCLLEIRSPLAQPSSEPPFPSAPRSTWTWRSTY